MNNRKSVITEAGISRNALTRPWNVVVLSTIHSRIQGTLNGKPTEFLLSSHEGVHYAYINALAQPWYVDTGAPLSSGAAIEFTGHPWHEA